MNYKMPGRALNSLDLVIVLKVNYIYEVIIILKR